MSYKNSVQKWLVTALLMSSVPTILFCGDFGHDITRSQAKQKTLAVLWGSTRLKDLSVPPNYTVKEIVQQYITELQENCARSVSKPFAIKGLFGVGLGVVSTLFGATAALVFSHSEIAEQELSCRGSQWGMAGLAGLTGLSSIYCFRKVYKEAIELRDICNQVIQEAVVYNGNMVDKEATHALRESVQYHSLAEWLGLGLRSMISTHRLKIPSPDALEDLQPD